MLFELATCNLLSFVGTVGKIKLRHRQSNALAALRWKLATRSSGGVKTLVICSNGDPASFGTRSVLAYLPNKRAERLDALTTDASTKVMIGTILRWNVGLPSGLITSS